MLLVFLVGYLSLVSYPNCECAPRGEVPILFITASSAYMIFKALYEVIMYVYVCVCVCVKIFVVYASDLTAATVPTTEELSETEKTAGSSWFTRLQCKSVRPQPCSPGLWTIKYNIPDGRFLGSHSASAKGKHIKLLLQIATGASYLFLLLRGIECSCIVFQSSYQVPNRSITQRRQTARCRLCAVVCGCGGLAGPHVGSIRPGSANK